MRTLNSLQKTNCHCERSEAISFYRRVQGLLRRYAPRNDMQTILCTKKIGGI